MLKRMKKMKKSTVFFVLSIENLKGKTNFFLI